MKVTFVLSYASHAGGVRVVARHAEALRRRGHDVLVISFPLPKKPLRHRISSLLHGRGWPTIPASRRSHLDDTSVTHRVMPVFGRLRDEDLPDADVIIATWWQTAEWIAPLSLSKGKKAYFIQHYETWGGPPERVDATWRLPMHKIVVSRWLAQIAREKCGDEDVTLVSNAVDFEQFHAPPRDKQPVPTVGVMYSPTPFKGCDISLVAVEQARRQIPSLQLIAFGAHAPTAELPLPPNTQYIKDPPQDQIRDIYARCDAWLFGSRTEGFGLPLLESMACRTPVIATPAGAAPELMEAGGGVLVKPEDPADMARALENVMRLTPAEWRQRSDSAFAAAQQFSWKDAEDRFEATLLKLIGRGDASPARSDERVLTSAAAAGGIAPR